VQEVQPDGPAVGALESEDVIVAIDGQPVGYVAELQAKIAAHRPGETVTLTVFRDRRRMDVRVRLVEAPINTTAPVVTERAVQSEARLGIGVEELDAALAQQLGFDAPGGLVLREVAPGSAAARRNVNGFIGSRLVRVNETAISTRADLARALDSVAPGEIVSLHFQDREGAQRVVNVRMP
jgi:serine protease Do